LVVIFIAVLAYNANWELIRAVELLAIVVRPRDPWRAVDRRARLFWTSVATRAATDVRALSWVGRRLWDGSAVRPISRLCAGGEYRRGAATRCRVEFR